jgi:hypothetical protein
MDRIIKFSGVFLWSLVLITAGFSYTAVRYQDNEKLVDLCNEDNHSPQNMLDSELNRLLRDLNALRLSNEDANNLKWIDSCTGWVMVELKSRKFEKKLQKPQRK